MKLGRGARATGRASPASGQYFAAAVAAIVLPVLAAVPANAQSVDPFREGTTWPGGRVKVTAYAPPAAPLAGQRSRLLPPGAAGVLADDDDDAPARPAAVAPRGASLVDGGGRPAISPMPPQRVSFTGSQGPGTIVIDTAGRQLFLVQAGGQALRYPISVGRQGFTWTGTEKISRIANWPDWHPPAEMRQRDPRLPEKMTGGVRNPLGAKALYLGNSLYRIHGTNDARTIGQAASSGCFRMMNGHVVDLAGRVGVGTTVVVMSRVPATAYSRVSRAPES